MRRRSSWARALGVVAVFAAIISTPSSGQAQTDARLLEAAPGPTAVLSVQTARSLGHLELFGGAVLDYTNDPLAALSDDASGAAYRPLHQRYALGLGLALGLWNRLEIGLSLPIYLRQWSHRYPTPGEGGASGIGDLRLMGKLALFSSGDEPGFGLAVAAELALPSGDEERLMGHASVAFTPWLVLDWQHASGLLIALNVGFRARERILLEDLPVGDELRLGAATELPLPLPGLSAGIELAAAIGTETHEALSAGFEERKAPLEALGLLRWRSAAGLVLTAGSGVGLTGGYGSPDLRIFIGVGYRHGRGRPSAGRPEPTERPAPPASRPTSHPASRPASRLSGPSDADFDRAAAADPDPDGDGLTAPLDRCPRRAEDPDGFKDADGCPDPDNDTDGVPDATDRCPLKAETINGVEDDDGCPDQGQAAVAVKGSIVALGQKVFFDSGSDVLKPGSFAILGQLAALLKARWAIRKVQVEGYTDDRGDKEMNVDLSERRARRVMQVLIKRGVAPHRLSARGFGPTRPIASNATHIGRAKNRRVVFRIITQVSAGGRP